MAETDPTDEVPTGTASDDLDPAVDPDATAAAEDILGAPEDPDVLDEEHDAPDASEEAAPPEGQEEAAGVELDPEELLIAPYREALGRATAERDEYLDQLQRSRAEFQNLRRRAGEQQARAIDDGARRLLGRLLDVLDNFGYVVDAIEEDDESKLATGVRMVHDELYRTLEAAGLEPIPGVGEPFDPEVHDALLSEEAPEPSESGEPVVGAVFRGGYRFKGRTLRPASVTVHT